MDRFVSTYLCGPQGDQGSFLDIIVASPGCHIVYARMTTMQDQFERKFNMKRKTKERKAMELRKQALQVCNSYAEWLDEKMYEHLQTAAVDIVNSFEAPYKNLPLQYMKEVMEDALWVAFADQLEFFIEDAWINKEWDAWNDPKPEPVERNIHEDEIVLPTFEDAPGEL